MSDDLLGRLRRKGRWVTVKRVPLFPQENEEEWRPDADSAEAADEIERLEAENADLRSRASSTLPAAVKAAASALIGRIDRGEPVRGFNACVEVVARWCLDERADQDGPA